MIHYYRRRSISEPFTEEERTRFRNLLELANSSKFDGERANALAAATRIATKHGMTLDEAARWRPEKADETAVSAQVYRRRGFETESQDAQTVAADAAQQREEKAKWKSAVDKARQRGLDEEETKKESNDKRPRNLSRSRRDPVKHAEVLLKETSLPFEEIADITGLSIYEIVGIKLKQRKAA